MGRATPLAPAAAALPATGCCSAFEILTTAGVLATAGTRLAHLDAVAGDGLHDLLGQLDDPAARVGQPPRVGRVLLHPGAHLRAGNAQGTGSLRSLVLFDKQACRMMRWAVHIGPAACAPLCCVTSKHAGRCAWAVQLGLASCAHLCCVMNSPAA